MVQLVMTDLDRTLLDDEGRISPQSIKAIELVKDKNIPFGIASGRANHIIEKIAKEFGIYDQVDYMIGYNGVVLYEKKTDQNINGKFLDKEIVKAIYESLKDMDLAFVVHLGNTMFTSKVSQYTEEERMINDFDQIIVEDFSTILDKDYPKLMIIGEGQILDQAIKRLKAYKDPKFTFFKSHDMFLEVLSQDLSKANMLSILCERNAIDLNKVLSIGDNYNDLDMVKISGYGVAVGNAVEALKNHAKLVVASNNEEGFSQAINYYML